MEHHVQALRRTTNRLRRLSNNHRDAQSHRDTHQETEVKTINTPTANAVEALNEQQRAVYETLQDVRVYNTWTYCATATIAQETIAQLTDITQSEVATVLAELRHLEMIYAWPKPRMGRPQVYWLPDADGIGRADGAHKRHHMADTLPTYERKAEPDFDQNNSRSHTPGNPHYDAYHPTEWAAEGQEQAAKASKRVRTTPDTSKPKKRSKAR